MLSVVGFDSNTGLYRVRDTDDWITEEVSGDVLIDTCSMGIDIKGVDVANKAVSVLNREYQPIVLKGTSVWGSSSTDCRSRDDPPSKDRLIERRKRTEFLEKSVQFDSYEGTKDGDGFTDFLVRIGDKVHIYRVVGVNGSYKLQTSGRKI